jgi:hypothetical protein
VNHLDDGAEIDISSEKASHLSDVNHSFEARTREEEEGAGHCNL